MEAFSFSLQSGTISQNHTRLGGGVAEARQRQDPLVILMIPLMLFVETSALFFKQNLQTLSNSLFLLVVFKYTLNANWFRKQIQVI